MIDIKQESHEPKLKQRQNSRQVSREPSLAIRTAMDRHARPPMRRAPTSGSISGEQLTREARSRRAREPLDQEDGRQRGASRESRASEAGGQASPEGRPFACPYAKYEPDVYSHRNVTDQEYRNCSTGYWTSIARLKQHLYRTHDRSLRCCENCWQNFPNDEQLRKHVQAQSCEHRPMPEEKMDAEQHQAVKERVQGRPVESWYKIYRILFPNEAEPPTPYAEWVTGQDLRNCFRLLEHRLPAMLFQAAIARQPQARDVQQEKNTTFPTTAELIQRAIQQCQREFGQRTGLSHVFTNRPISPTGSVGSGSDRGAVPASMIRPNPDLRHGPHGSLQKDEDSDSSEDMDIDQRHSQLGGSYARARGSYQTVPYTSSAPYAGMTATVSEEDVLQAQYIQDQLLQNQQYGWQQQ